MQDKWRNDKIVVKWTKRMPPDWASLPTIESDGVWYRYTKADEEVVENLLVDQHQA